MGWPLLEKRREHQNLVQFFKIVRNLAPPGLTNALPNAIQNRNPYNIRSAHQIDIPRAKSEAYANPFFPSTCKRWNDLPENVKHIPSLEEFKEITKPDHQKLHLITTLGPEKSKF